MEINITKELLQAMIAHNKKQIRELEKERKQLQELTISFWPYCNPADNNNKVSQAYFYIA